MDTSCIVLAGGKSVRLGHDKVLEKINDKSLLEQVVSNIDSLGKEIIIVAGEERPFPRIISRSNIRIVSDIFPGKGSLGGIYTGLVASRSLYNLVVASDMPFLNRPLLHYMIEVADGFDFVLPRVNNLYEPLHAVYSTNCVAPIKKMIEEGHKMIIELFDHVNFKYVEAAEIDRFDPHHLSFFNINTQEDLDLAKKLATGENPA